MKRLTKRLIAVVMVMAILATAAAGCKKSNGDELNSGVAMPEFVFVPEYIDLPEGLTDLSNLIVIGEKLYFSTQILADEENYTYETKLMSMNFDGTGMSELSGYTLGAKPEGAIGNDYIQNMMADGDGNLWVVENGNYYTYDLPEDFDETTDNMWDFYRDMGSKTSLRKLDTNGAEILSIDVSSLANDVEYFYIRNMNIDGDGNIYIALDQVIFVLDSNGVQQFKLEISNWVDQLMRMPDGSVAMFGYVENGRALRKINYQTRTWGEDIDLPQNAYQIISGNEEYVLLFNDSNNLYGLEEGTKESVKLLNWIDSDISNDGLGNITMLPDGRVLCTSYQWNNTTNQPNFELIILTKVPSSTLPPRTILTMACMWLDWNLRNAIIQFNKTNENYRIQVTDYSEFNTEDDWQAGLTKLSAEIISGIVPDILFISNLPYNQYVAKGLLEDLYPFIETDREFSRSDMMEAAFRAVETDGKLYQIFSNFSISTLSGHPAVLGEGMGWNMDEFRAVLRENPQADYPIGQYMNRTNFLYLTLTMGMNEYVDWSAGKCYFDNGGFAQLLEFANTFPYEIDWENMEWISMEELVASGRQIISTNEISDFLNTQMYKAQFGGEIVFKGYPTESRKGNILSPGSGIAMTTRCVDKEGAWEFMRIILTEDWQRSNMRWNFPTNKVVFDEILKEAMTPEYYIDEFGNEVESPKMSYGTAVPMPAPRAVSASMSVSSSGAVGAAGMIEIYALTQEEADQILALIDSVSGTAGYDESLMTIINEGADVYFSGRRTAQDAAGIIQSRASIYVSEQS